MNDELDDDHPLWLVNEQIKGLLEGHGAGEDHLDVVAFLRSTGLPESTVSRMHQALVHGDTKIAPARVTALREEITALRKIHTDWMAHLQAEIAALSGVKSTAKGDLNVI